MLDVILTVLTGLSNLASVGIAWKSYLLQRTAHQQAYQRDQFRHTVRDLERQFEIVFEALDEIMQLFR
jgi:hypothetical protein